MDATFTAQMQKNMLNYKSSLERIIDKYSKLEYRDGIDVDLNAANIESLQNFPDLADVSVRFGSQGATGNSQLELTLQEDGANDECVSSDSTEFSSEDDYGSIAKGCTSQLNLSPLDESSRNSSLLGLQPEDVDDELDMTFKSRGCPLADLYPGMVDRVKQAWSRQHTAEAADLVLRRYRRWRQQPSRSSFNNYISAPTRHIHHKQTARRKCLDGSLKMCDIVQSPLKAATNQQAWSAMEDSPGRVRRQQPMPVFVIDLSDVSETLSSTKVSLNETFDVPEPKPHSTFDFSPSRSPGSPEMTLRSKRLSLAARSLQANENRAYVTDRPGDSRSPGRQSPLRSRPMIFSRSSRASLISPVAHSMEGFSREPMRRRSMSESVVSTANMPLRGFCPQGPRLSFMSQPSPKRSASTSDPRRLRRHLSFDSSLPASESSWSREKLDEEFIKLYHRFVCQNRASFHYGPPCRFCARSCEVSKGRSNSPSSSSSSALAALALSPHRSLLRKRHREMSWDSHPQSKRLRDECYASSPGSKRHVKEMLRRRLSPFERGQACDRISSSPRSSNLLSKFNNQPHELQDVWMSQSSRMFH